MNLPLFNQIIEILKEESNRTDNHHQPLQCHTDINRFVMGDWVCGTSACIAGHAIVLYNYNGNISELSRKIRNQEYTSDKIEQLGIEALGISYIQAQVLFFASQWPKQFRDRLYDAEANGNYTEYCNVAIARIEYFIKYGN